MNLQQSLIALTPIDLKELREPLVLTHHNWKGKPELFWAHDSMPAEFTVIGRIEPSEQDVAIECYTFTGWHSVPFQALTQWRWDHDREALLREEEAAAAAEAERRQKVAAARAEFMRTLTLDSLAARQWLPAWEQAAERLASVRAILSQLVEDLRSEPKLNKGVVKRMIKRSVQGLNRLDVDAHFIATIEREELCEVYEQIACAAGYPEVADDVDDWRNW